MSRDQEATSGARVEVETTPKVEKAALKQAVKFAEPKDDDKPVGATKVCSGHLGKQLAAARKYGRSYTCAYGKDCTFVHISMTGKSDQKLLEVAATMPPPMKQDINSSSNPYHKSSICSQNSNNVHIHVYTVLVPYRYCF
jgi:hypothetical protein